MLPSAPTGPRISNRDAANAFAAAQPNKPDHLSRQACSARFPHQRNLATGAGPGQLGDKIACFAGEPASYLHCKNDEACPAPCPEEFGVTAFFPLSGGKECQTVPVSGAPPWSSVSVQSADQCGVYRQLHATVQWETVNHDL